METSDPLRTVSGDKCMSRPNIFKHTVKFKSKTKNEKQE